MLRNGGVLVTDGRGTVLQNLIISGFASAGVSVQGNSASVTVRNCTIAVSGHQLRLGGLSTVTFENNIAVAEGPGQFCILPEGGQLISDYNNLVARNGAWMTVAHTSRPGSYQSSMPQV